MRMTVYVSFDAARASNSKMRIEQLIKRVNLMVTCSARDLSGLLPLYLAVFSMGRGGWQVYPSLPVGILILSCFTSCHVLFFSFHQSCLKKNGELFSMDSFTPATYIHYIAECCRKKDLVVIYKIDDPDYMLDEAILKVIIPSK